MGYKPASEIKASGGSQPRIKEGASHHARRGKNAETFLIVSTDFLLGETDIPDRKNYDIEELGLSTESAKLLYTGKIDSGILNLLIENPKFAHLIRPLALYKDETMLAGIRAANQNYTFLRSLLMGQARFHPEDTATATDLAQKLSDLKTPPVSADTAAIRTIFMQIVADIKASAASESKMYQAATSEILEDFRNTLTKGEEGFDLKSLTVDDMVQAIMHYKSEMPLEKSLIVNGPISITASVFSIMFFMIKAKPQHIFISA